MRYRQPALFAQSRPMDPALLWRSVFASFDEYVDVSKQLRRSSLETPVGVHSPATSDATVPPAADSDTFKPSTEQIMQSIAWIQSLMKLVGLRSDMAAWRTATPALNWDKPPTRDQIAQSVAATGVVSAI